MNYVTQLQCICMAKSNSKRPPKLENLLQKIREAIEVGNYYDVTHALERQTERNITRNEYEYVLAKSG